MPPQLSLSTAFKRFIGKALIVLQVLMPVNSNARVSATAPARYSSPPPIMNAWAPFLHKVSTTSAMWLAEVRKALPESPNAERELSQLARTQFDEALVASHPASRSENEAFLHALRSYRQRSVPDDFRALDQFLADYPTSGWRLALLTNLGLSYYHYGYFSKAISAWETVWKEGRPLTDPPMKTLVDRAIGELIRMHARIGHADVLESLLAEVKDRSVTGPATEAVDGAKQGLWTMRNDPGIAYLCGPMALKNLLLSNGVEAKRIAYLDTVRSGRNGFTLSQVEELARQVRLPQHAVFRRPDQPVPVPALIHWKVGHFAAIVAQNNNRFHVQDPTFGTDLWVTRSAIDSEASGYFLIANASAKDGWRSVSSTEASRIRGMGFTQSGDPNLTTGQDDNTSNDNKGKDASNNQNNDGDSSTPNPQDDCGMCVYSITEMLVSIRISDTPVGYRPSRGPSMYTSLTYNQREATQPATFGWSNISPKWTMNWSSYIEDDPTMPGGQVIRHIGGGGALAYVNYNSDTGQYDNETRNGAALFFDPANPSTYRRQRTEGSVEIFSTSNGSTSFPRRIFLTKVIDPAGNAITFNYDDQLRLASITDATNRSTTFTYALPANPLLVTAITDPFGRSAQLTYDDRGRLSQITDVIGITSSFTYDASGLINALQTPYGVSTFSYGEDGNTRFAQATDPLGNSDYVEYDTKLESMPESEDPSTVPVGFPPPFTSPLNDYNQFRNSFIWDKHAFAVAGGDYSAARLKHWFHSYANTNFTSGVIEGLKNPYENRIWYAPPNSAGTGSAGALGLGQAISSPLIDKRSYVGRVLDDGSTQLSSYLYLKNGKLSRAIDPVGRTTLFNYAAPDNIDLVQVLRETSQTTFPQLASFTYDQHHQPLVYKDAAARATSFVYDSNEQLIQVTDPVGAITKYQRDALGRVTQIINADNKTAATFTYDSYDRVATRTDSEGYSLQFAYDALDRLTQVTFPDGTTRKYAWTNLDLASVTDRQGRVTTYTYDALRRLIDIADPLSRHTKFGYWENGKLKTLTDPNGNITTWNIDIAGRATSKVYADGSQVTYNYENTTSRLSSVTDPLGQIKQYKYATDNLVASIRHVNAVNPTPNVTFAYDPVYPRVTSMTDGNGTRQYQYFPVNVFGALRLMQESGPFQNDTIAYTYDALGRINQRTVDVAKENFTYDAIGRLKQVIDPLGTSDLTYLGETSQIASQTLRGTAVQTNWTYDTNTNDRRLTAITNGGAARSFTFQTSPENLIEQIKETPGSGSSAKARTWNYGYDDADRLLTGSATDGSQYAYGYDGADNILAAQSPAGTASGSYNALNQATSFGGQPIVYDANGNVLDDGVRTYTWDAENRLLSAASKAQAGVVTTFRYDGYGRRVAIVTSNGGVTTETRYLWCGQRICQARSTNDVVIHRYYGEGEVGLGGTALLYANDHLGSVRDVVYPQSGNSLASFDYDPYGTPTRSTGTTTDLRYAGMFYEANSGLYLTQYRAYDPRTARWLSRDPIGELRSEPGSGVYSYVHGRPIDLIDPLGLDVRRYTGVYGHEWDEYDVPNGGLVTVGFGPAVPGNAGPGKISVNDGPSTDPNSYAPEPGTAGYLLETVPLSPEDGQRWVDTWRNVASQPDNVPDYTGITFNCEHFACLATTAAKGGNLNQCAGYLFPWFNGLAPMIPVPFF